MASVCARWFCLQKRCTTRRTQTRQPKRQSPSSCLSWRDRSSAATRNIRWRTACCWIRWITKTLPLNWEERPIRSRKNIFRQWTAMTRTSFRRQSGKSWMSWKSCFWKASSYSAMSNFCTATAVCIRCSTATCCSTAVCRWMRTERSKPSIWREGFIRAEATWIMRIWLPVGRSSTRTRRSVIWISCGICGAAAILRCRAG